jgi:hypothetical protein
MGKFLSHWSPGYGSVVGLIVCIGRISDLATGGGSEAYGVRLGPRQYLLTSADEVNPPLEWDEPVPLQFTNQENPTESWKKEFPSSREFFAYWEKKSV